MARQLYITADPAPYTPATFKGGWDATADCVDLLWDMTKTTADPDMFTIQSVSSAETSASHLYRVCLIRLVTGPLLAQTISGTMQVMVGALASDAAAEMFFSLHLWATTGDSDTVRCTLLNQFTEPASSNNPFPTEPKGRDLIVTAALTAGTIEDDDRLVLEMGYMARNTDATEYTGTLYYGTDYYSNGSPDMVRDE